MKCSDCKFWVADSGTKEGFCQRNPPQSVTESFNGDCYYFFCFPRINENRWCGEFQAREQEQNE